MSPYCISAISGYSIEYDTDYWRERINRLYPSRLSAIYAFGDLETCHLVSEKHKWPMETLCRFKIGTWPFTRIVKVNMEIVSLMRRAVQVSSVQGSEAIWNHYWSGGGNMSMTLPNGIFESGVVWEYLIDGFVDRIREN